MDNKGVNREMGKKRKYLRNRETVRRERAETSYILKAGDWDSSDRNKTKTEGETNRGTVGFCIGMERVCFVVTFPLFFSFSVSLILSLSLCVHIETSILETGEWEREREFGRLPISSSPWRPWDQASKESTHTHTLLPPAEENSLALCYTENPTFPQSDRQVDSWVLH